MNAWFETLRGDASRGQAGECLVWKSVAVCGELT